ncbi:NUDIX domain-containing protein [Sphingomonas piscis]|nr:NUDIX hydrolase [Sphingomonas piscis]
MVERAGGMSFAAGAWVFPGGRVDPLDVALATALGLGEADSLRLAAIRETLEECAIPVGIEPAPSPQLARQMQHELLHGNDLETVLVRHELDLVLNALIPLARWIPPLEVSRRFDTTFFVALMNDGDRVPNIIDTECTAARWVTAREMLRQEEARQAALIYPTRKNLERLAQFDSFTAILDHVAAHPLIPITAAEEVQHGQRFVTIPEGRGYPITRDPIDRVKRA